MIYAIAWRVQKQVDETTGEDHLHLPRRQRMCCLVRFLFGLVFHLYLHAALEWRSDRRAPDHNTR